MYNFLFIFSLFITYSFLGWFIESSINSIIYKKCLNRGFLIGPYCPIYGVASLIMLLFLTKYKDDPIALFIMAVVICSTLEYFTSYIMEKLFKARWWDYSHTHFNINGRICLNNSLIFGLLGLLLILFINPFISNLINSIPHTLFLLLSSFVFILFFVDVFVSFNIISKIKFPSYAVNKDYTYEISSKVKNFINTNSIFNKRIFNAFPNIKLSKIKPFFKK